MVRVRVKVRVSRKHSQTERDSQKRQPNRKIESDTKRQSYRRRDGSAIVVSVDGSGVNGGGVIGVRVSHQS